MAKRIIFVIFAIGISLLGQGVSSQAGGEDQKWITLQEQRVMEWRKERDAFFKNHQRSPLLSQDKKNFKGLKYYSFKTQNVFSGEIERFIFNINNPRYYVTFLTNKGTSKRYI